MPLHVALVHHPTVDKAGDAAATSVTNLDVHDLSRIGRTYGVDGLWIVHPHEQMHRYVERVFNYWREGFGAAYNPTRKESLHVTSLVRDLCELEEKLEARYPDGTEVLWIATSARRYPNTIKTSLLRQWLADPRQDRVFCLVFGTGWGLHPSVLEEMDYLLEPIQGPTDWNHLSVRAAAAIILDRLLGIREP